MELMDCPACGFEMRYRHEHDECTHCGLIVGCCEGTTIGAAKEDVAEEAELLDPGGHS